jgi:hypothetical protein
VSYRIATLAEVLSSPPLLDAEGWLIHPDFIRIDGVPAKTYTEANSGANGLAGHSVVGEEPDFLDGVPNRFLSMEMVAPGRFSDYAAASCMFILRKRVAHVVMYPTWAATWTSGSRAANLTTWAAESEGGLGPFNEPLTEHQQRGEIVIATAWEQRYGRWLSAGDLSEHRQLIARFGGGATACASGRYAQVFERIRRGERYIPEDEVQQEDFNDLVMATFSAAEDRDADGKPLPKAERLPIAMDRMRTRAAGSSLQSVSDRAESGIALAQDHAANHPGGGGTGTPAHTHVPGGVAP